MLQSPAKRRKVTSTRSVPSTTTRQDATSQSQPTTPTRASYASPTKASLARSHPNILARSPGRRISRVLTGKNLREDILGSKEHSARNEEGNQPRNGAGAAAQASGAERMQPVPGTVDGFSAASARAFEVARPPLNIRQPSTAKILPSPREPSVDDLPPMSQPKLVERQAPPSVRDRHRTNEPDLPPTAVQLGIAPAPERPRGLASSSSPGGSRSGSGSGKNRRRLRTAGGGSTSSPLKPKAAPRQADLGTTSKAVANRPVTPVEEAPESEPDGDDENELSLPEDLREKRTTRNSLLAQLERLKADMERLEALAENVNNITDDDLDTATLSLLTTPNPSCSAHPEVPTSKKHSFHDLVTLGANGLSSLTLFAPGNLKMSNSTSMRTQNGRIQTVHTINLTAPAPWPPNVFCAALEVVADAEDTRTVSINLKDSSETTSRNVFGAHPTLHKWISSRLDSPLFRHDVSTIVNGVGQYFDQCVQRAREWNQLAPTQENSGYQQIKNPRNPAKSGFVTEEEMRSLLPFLTLHTYVVDLDDFTAGPNANAGSWTKSSNHKKLLLTGSIDLTWTGGTKRNIHVATCGLSVEAGKNVKKVFAALMETAGVVEAVRAVMRVVSGDESGRDGTTEGNEGGSKEGSGEKARRKRKAGF